MNYIKSIDELKEDCRLFMADKGLPIDGPIIADGKINRYSADTNQRKRDEWYIAYEGISTKGNAYITCVFGSWSNSSKHEYRSFETHHENFNNDALQELRSIADAQRREAEHTIKKTHADAAIRAQTKYKEATDTPPSPEFIHYATVKGIKLCAGIKYGPNKQQHPSMIIPIMNAQGEIRSLQAISMSADGIRSYKGFLEGGEIRGNYYIIGQIGDQAAYIFICEGYATGATVHEASGHPVVIAFFANNIGAVVGSLKQQYPHIDLVIAADDDAAGLNHAHEAAKKYGCQVIVPAFPAHVVRGAKDTDFNDLYKLAGIEEVKRQLLEINVTNTTEDSQAIEPEVVDPTDQQFAKEYFAGEPCGNFKLSMLPPVLAEYVSSIHKTTNAHPIMITASVLTMIASYLGTKVVIKEGEYFQDLYPNLWTLCIAKSGQFKTTALNKGARIACENQSRVFSAIKQMRENASPGDYEVEKGVLELSRENVLLPTKITAEALLEYLAQGHHGGIYASEFGGWLQNFEKTYNNDFKTIITEFYDVPKNYRYKTKTQGDCVIEKPCISICGVSTLVWIKSNMKPTDVPSGFFARFLIFTPPFEEGIPPALPPAVDDHSEDAENKMTEVIDRILKSVGSGRHLSLTQDAKKVFASYHMHIYRVHALCGEAMHELLSPYVKRWSPALLKKAMMMQLLLDPTSQVITDQAVVVAFHVLSPAIKSTILLFSQDLGESEHQRKCRVTLEWITNRTRRDKKPARRQAILSSKLLPGGAKEYDEILHTLIEQGKIIYTQYAKKNESEYSVVDGNDEH